MVKVVVDSRTGMGKNFILKCGVSEEDIIDINNVEGNLGNNDDVILQTRCHGFGKVPDTTLQFLDNYANKINVLGTSVTGNRNWGEGYGRSANIIQEKYGIPNILIFEGRGFPSDVDKMVKYLDKLGYFEENIKDEEGDK